MQTTLNVLNANLCFLIVEKYKIQGLKKMTLDLKGLAQTIALRRLALKNIFRKNNAINIEQYLPICTIFEILLIRLPRR